MGDVVEVAEHVFLVRGSNVNWYLLREGTDLTLVDAGYPGDLDWVEESVRSLGRRPEDIGAILLTHAHVDHMGAINAFHDRYGTPVLMDAVEVPRRPPRVPGAGGGPRRADERVAARRDAVGAARDAVRRHEERRPRSRAGVPRRGRARPARVARAGGHPWPHQRSLRDPPPRGRRGAQR